MKKYLLNSAVIAAGAHGVYRYSPATWDELRAFVKAPELQSRIGYAETAELIGRITGWKPPLCMDASVMEKGDLAMVVRLKYRVDPKRKGFTTHADIKDWEIAKLERIE